MARTRSDFKTCKHCGKTSTFAWVKLPVGWRLHEGALSASGNLMRDEKGNPLPAKDGAGNLIPHVCNVPPREQAPSPKDEPKETQPPKAENPPAQPKAAKGTLEGILSDMIGTLVESRLVRLEAALAAGKPPVIKIGDKPPIPIPGGFVHKQFKRIMAILARGKNVFLWGGPGGGKSYLAHQIQSLLRENGTHKAGDYILMVPTISKAMIEGYFEPSGNFRSTPFVDWYRDGGIHIVDEISNAPGPVTSGLQGMLSNSTYTFGNHLPIKKHANALMIACDNTNGNGGTVGHETRQPLDIALKDRFVFEKFEYDEDLEEKITLSLNPDSKEWLRWVRKVREYCEAHPGSRVIASPRSSYDGAILLSGGDFNFSDAAEMALFKGASNDIRRSVLNSCPLPR